jgi:hypothetical protein
MDGGVSVRNGASLVVADGATINGGLLANGASAIHVFGARVNGDTQVTGAGDVILVGSRFNGNVTLTGNSSPDVTILSGATRNYGVLVIGNTVSQTLGCTGNTPSVNDFDVPNTAGAKAGQCTDV